MFAAYRYNIYFNMKSKAQGLSLNTIIIAALVLIVLVVLVIIFSGRMGRFGKTLTEAEETEDICIYKGGVCKEDCPAEEYIEGNFKECTGTKNKCCKI